MFFFIILTVPFFVFTHNFRYEANVCTYGQAFFFLVQSMVIVKPPAATVNNKIQSVVLTLPPVPGISSTGASGTAETGSEELEASG